MDIFIEKIVYPGKSLAKKDNKVIFTDEGLPGELVKIDIVKDKRSYFEAKTLEIITPSIHRTTAKCSHFKICSNYQYIDYPFQLKIKETQIKETFKRQLNINLENEVIKPSPVVWGYRNKAHFHIIWEKGIPNLAYHCLESTDEYVKISKCFLLPDSMHKTLQGLLKTMSEERLNSIKELVIKESFLNKDTLIIPRTMGFTTDTITEKIGPKTFHIGPASFFQINIPMFSEAIKDLKTNLDLNPTDIICDLYCGTGAIGISIASAGNRLICVDSDEENIRFLRKNLETNSINDFQIHKARSEDFINNISKENIRFLIVDPPRKGLDSHITKSLLKGNIPFIIYLSCDLSTLTRDLKPLLTKYKLHFLKAYDFFPHTPHIETLCILKN